MTAMIATMTNATPTAQSSNPSSAIASAVTAHNKLFALYVFFLLLTVVLTYLVWKSGNSVQDAVRSEADARIGEARIDSANANKRAGEANERAGELEKQAAELNKQTAELHVVAEELRVKVAETELALVNAKSELALVQKRQQFRFGTFGSNAFIAALKESPRKPVAVEIWSRPDDDEAAAFATMLAGSMSGANWLVRDVRPVPKGATQSWLIGAPAWVLEQQSPIMRAGANPDGLTVFTNVMDPGQFANPTEPIGFLLAALTKSGTEHVSYKTEPHLADGFILIIIAVKPS